MGRDRLMAGPGRGRAPKGAPDDADNGRPDTRIGRVDPAHPLRPRARTIIRPAAAAIGRRGDPGRATAWSYRARRRRSIGARRAIPLIRADRARARRDLSVRPDLLD